MIEDDKWNRCASKLLGRPDYDVSRDGYDFLITRFNKFAASIDNFTIGSSLEWCAASVSILNEDTNFREFENRTELRNIFRNMYGSVLSECERSIGTDEHEKDKKPGSIFRNLYLIQPCYKNVTELFVDALNDTVYTEDGISKKIQIQLENMRIAMTVTARRKNHPLHLEDVTIKLYEHSMRCFVCNFLQNADDLKVFITNVDRVTEKMKETCMSKYGAKTLLSTLNHYMRFFPNDRLKSDAKTKYKETLDVWIHN